MRIARIALVAALLPVSACAAQGGGGQDPGVTGRTFVSTEVTGRTLVPGTRLELSFPHKGKFRVRAGCNQLGGDVSFDGDRMKVTGQGMTLVGCDPARSEQDTWVRAFLESGPRFALNGDELVLTGGAGGAEVVKLIDKQANAQDKPLPGTHWVLESLISGQTASSVPRGAHAFLQFGTDTVTGSTGCNTLNGKAVQSGETITFSEIATTWKACADQHATMEKTILAVVSGQVLYSIDGDVLWLRHPGGNSLMLRTGGMPSVAAS